jgi:AcrR family transcriptional regulator
MSVTAVPGPRGKARRDTWRWKSTGATRDNVLTAALELFTERGYSHVKLTDVLTRAGVSTGSFYHHFAAKQDLFTELWRDHCAGQDRAATAAQAAARRAGLRDPVELWAAGVRGLLQHTWRRRERARLFAAGEVPPDFDALRRERDDLLARRTSGALELADGAEGDLYAGCLQGLIGAGVQAVTEAGTAGQAQDAIDATLRYCLRFIACCPRPDAQGDRPACAAGNGRDTSP